MKKLFSLLLMLLFLITACRSAPQMETPPAVETEPADLPPAATPLPPAGSLPSALLLDPANADAASQEINIKLYETLPELSVSQPVISDDGLSYAFQLVQGVSFHDGTPLSADAVVANFNRWYDPEDPLRGNGEFAAWQAAFGGFKGDLDANGKAACLFDGIEKVDEYTVLIHLNRPDPDFLTKIADIAFGIVSPAALAKDGSNYGTLKGTAAGTGPYKLGAWTDQGITLEPNPAYRGEIPAQPLEFK